MYDPMVAKLIVWDVDREKATRRMLRALGEYDSGGLTTLIPFHKAILATEQWAKGETCRDLMEDREWLKSTAPADADAARALRGGRRGRQPATTRSRSRGKLFDVKVIGEAPAGGVAAPAAAAARNRRSASAKAAAAPAPPARRCPRRSRAPSSKSPSSKGAEVDEGDLICVIEAMKMENEITAHRSGKVEELNVSEGAAVRSRRHPRRHQVAPQRLAGELTERLVLAGRAASRHCRARAKRASYEEAIPPPLNTAVCDAAFLRVPCSFRRSSSRRSLSTLRCSLARQREFRGRFRQVWPTQASRRTSWAWRKARIGK